MQDITDLERRISAALARIGSGIEALATSGAAPPSDEGAPMADEAAAAEIARLAEALDEEKMANAQLSERLRVVRERDAEARAGLEAKLAEVTSELAALRSARAEEAAEVAAIVAALDPIVEGGTHA
jgi:chromosome segregation ATPase